MPYQARFPGGAFSIARSTAPPHSPPRPRPWPKRQSASSSGAAKPMAAVGRQRANGDGGERPWSSSATHQRGLAADAIAEVAEERRADRPREEGDAKRRERGERGGGRVGRGKEQLGKYEHRRGRVDVEVEELDGGADEAGEQHLAGAVHGQAGAGAILANRDVDAGWLAHGSLTRPQSKAYSNAY